MKEQKPSSRVSRRRFLALGGSAVALAAGLSNLPVQQALAVAPTQSTVPIQQALTTGKVLAPAAATPITTLTYDIVATDGWIALPGTLKTPTGLTSPYHPDPLAGGNGNQTTYIFGFRDATGLAGGPLSLKGQAQASAPLLFVDENTDITIRLTNAGLQQRPDLVDSHTIHWHGFRNAIPLFDGVPEMSISVPIGANFTYYYKPVNAGTYMYHCHFEDVEHIHMGMTGVIFVRPIQNKGLNWNDPSDPLNSGTKTAMFGTTPIPTGTGYKYAYNDGVLPGDPNSTFYHREFALFLSEVWAQAHWNDAHIQATDWSEYAPDFWLMNGRSYPDTLALGSDPLTVPTDPRLQFQPISSLITANAGEQVLLRLVTLGYQQAAMTVPGITLRTIAKDAVYLKSRDNTSTAFDTNTVYIGPGESTDVIFTAPAFIGGNGAYDTYYLYNRNYVDSTNDSSASGGFGGQMTEIRVYPANTLTAQTTPNT